MSRTRDSLLELLVYGHGFQVEVPFRGLNGKRRFKFDAARPADVEASGAGYAGIAVDYHGWGAGAGHIYREKQAGDHEKLSEAQLCGWVYIVCNALSVNNGRCVEYIELAMSREAS